jgi:hypothetical protein
MNIEYYDEAQEAFAHALSIKTFNEKDDNHYFVGDWMFMGSDEKALTFKNRYTKDYIYVEKGPRLGGLNDDQTIFWDE